MRVEVTPTNPRKVTASPVKFRVEGFILVVVVSVDVIIQVELLIIIQITKFGDVEDLTRSILNLRPEFFKHLVGFLRYECNVTGVDHEVNP
jgi:hypothetical protein